MPVRMKDAKEEKRRDIEFAKREFEFRRGITPYVCSTGDDFQVEHELLSARVFPELDRLCHERGVFFSPTEMKYKKSDNLVQKGHLLTSAFRFIERCAPFFIGLIGERYGYYRNPEEPLLSDKDEGNDWLDRNFLIAAKSGHDWVLDDSVQCKSLTELQFLYGAFKNNTRRNLVYEEAENQCYFYYRQPEHKDNLFKHLSGSERAEKLKRFEPENDYCNLRCRNLKADIIKKGHAVRYFQAPEELCGMVLKDWRTVIDEFCPPIYASLNITERKEKDIYLDWLTHENFAEHKRDSFHWLPEYNELSGSLTRWALTALDDPPEGWDKPTTNSNAVKAIKDGKREYPEALYQSIVCLVGDRGSGKSSFIAHWVREFQQDYSFLNVFTHYVESSAASDSVVTMLKRCMAYFSNQLQHNYESIDEECLRENNLLSLGEVFSAAVSHKPCVIVLDGLDDLGKSTSESQVRDLSWLLYPLPPHVRLIVTTCRSDISYTALKKRPDTSLLHMPPLTSVQSQKIVFEQHVREMAGRLPDDSLTFLFDHCKLADRPLFLQLVASEAQHYSVYTDFENYIESVLEKCSVRDLLNMLVLRWIEAYSWAGVTTSTPKSTLRQEKKIDTIGESGGWVAEVLRLLVVSKHGICAAEILEFLEQMGYHGDNRVTHYDLIMFLDIIHGTIVYEAPDGVLRFSHQHIKEGVEHTLLSPVTIDTRKDLNTSAVLVPRKTATTAQAQKQLDKKIYHTYLADYYISKPHSDRRTQELPWQLLGCKDMKRLQQVLTEPRLFMDLMENTVTRLEVCDLWECLLAAGYDPGSTYTDMMAMQIHDNDVPEITISDMEPVESSTARESEHTLEIPLTPRVDIHNLGKYTAQLLLLFDCYEAALQVSLSAFNKLSQICPLEHAQEQLKCELESQIAASYHALGMHKDAVRWYDRALGTVTDMLAMSMLPRQEKILKQLRGNVLIELAALQIKGQNHRMAENMLNQARKCMTESDNLIGGAKALLKVGVLKAGERDFFKAHEYLQLAQSEYEKWFGRNHHQVSDVLHEFAVLLSNENNTYRIDDERAQRLYRRALKLREQAYGKSHLKVAETLFCLGQLLKLQKNILTKNEALSFLQRAYDVHNNQLGPEHPISKKLYKNMNDLEIAIKYKPQYHVENRMKELPYSTLSWHEHELDELEMRARRKTAQRNVGTIRMSMKVITAFKGLARAKSAASRGTGLGGFFLKKTQEEGDQGMATQTQPLDESPKRLTQTLGVLLPAKDGAAHVSSFVSESSLISELDNTGEIENKEELETIRESEVLESSVLAEGDHLTPSTSIPLRSQSQINVSAESEVGLKHAHVRAVASYNDFIRIPTDKPPSKIESRLQESAGEYLENYSMASSKTTTPRASAQKRVLRPQSAPYKMLQKFQHVGVSPRTSAVIPHAKREISSAPAAQYDKEAKARIRIARGENRNSHRSRCPAPHPHAFDSTNTFSAINGPNTSTESLLGPKPCPREIELRLQHTSAWYHVPGRYPTNDQPYPPKRSQVRIHDAHRKLVRNLHTRSHSKLLLTSTFPTYIGTKHTSLNPIEQNNFPM